MRLLLLIAISLSSISGIIAQTPLVSEKDSVSYSLGIIMGTSIGSAGIESLNEDLFMKGINDAIVKAQPLLTPEQANNYLNQYVTLLSNKRAAKNLEEGMAFLRENSQKEGVVSLPSGLQYKVIRDGIGANPVDTSNVTVNYTGTLLDGSVFDSSFDRGEPAQFMLNRVIPGWTEALKLMKTGAKWTLYIPPSLAYGERGSRTIPPNSVLIFEVELLNVQ